jgi:isopentenyl phosphate kinase
MLIPMKQGIIDLMLIFLKLGGSLITQKDKISSARFDKIAELAQEIAGIYKENPQTDLIIGHGSGSFGHMPGRKYQTRAGVHNSQEWTGFVEVWKEARRLNQIMVENLLDAGLPVIAFPPSAIYQTSNGKITSSYIKTIQSAISHHLIPLVNGDVIFDEKIGGTILSTEEVFLHLASKLKADQIMLAGIEQGVWEDFPDCTRLIKEINSSNVGQIINKLSGSQHVDVTGGMLSKVINMLKLAKKEENLKILIFSGETRGNISKAFHGEKIGTLIQG